MTVTRNKVMEEIMSWKGLVMKRIASRCLIGVIIMFGMMSMNRLAQHSGETERLVFTGQGADWEALLEIEQSTDTWISHEVKERVQLTYHGEALTEDHPIQWNVAGLLSDETDVNEVSHFQAVIGTDEGGATYETNASHHLAERTDSFHVTVTWAQGKTDTIVLAYMPDETEMANRNNQ